MIPGDNAASATAIGAATLQVQSMGLTQLAPISSGAAWDVDPYNWRSAGISLSRVCLM